MNTSPKEIFVLQLARASKRARRFVRHLSKEDREDVISSALLWCWENRENYSLTTSLETWFVNAVRDAYKTWQRGEVRHAAERLEDDIPTPDTAQAGAEALEAAEHLIRSLPTEYKTVALLQSEGLTRPEIMAEGITKRVVDDARKYIRQLRRLIPDDHEYRRTLRTPPARSSDDLAHMTTIDRELERLDFAPPAGKECPPCWRCLWFYGYMPGEYRPTRMTIQEPEVRDAVRDTEARKIEIAGRIRDGDI